MSGKECLPHALESSFKEWKQKQKTPSNVAVSPLESSFKEWKRGKVVTFRNMHEDLLNLPLRNGNRVFSNMDIYSSLLLNLPLRNGNFGVINQGRNY